MQDGGSSKVIQRYCITVAIFEVSAKISVVILHFSHGYFAVTFNFFEILAKTTAGQKARYFLSEHTRPDI